MKDHNKHSKCIINYVEEVITEMPSNNHYDEAAIKIESFVRSKYGSKYDIHPFLDFFKTLFSVFIILSFVVFSGFLLFAEVSFFLGL